MCFLSLNSTTFTMVVQGDHEKEQDKFVEGFLEASRGSCKLSISLAHHPFVSNGSHGDAGGRIKRFYKKLILGKMDVILAGHDHNTGYDGVIKGTHNIVSGAGGKIRVPRKYKKSDKSAPIETDRGWVNFNLGYVVMVYQGEGKATFTEKYINKDDELVVNPKIIEVEGKGIR